MTNENNASQPIGIFDSGIGGLSVLREIRKELPCESVVYFADQGHIPYGPRPIEQIRDYSVAITKFLLSLGAKSIVVACNTASAAALHYLRELFPVVSFVGMEPAVKPAAETTQTGKVGVLATPTTFAGELYASVVERFAKDVKILKSTCPGLVERIEMGDLESKKTRAILEDALIPMLDAGIDTVVLGCTHYPFVIPLINSITGPDVRTIDPAPAIARQVRRILTGLDLLKMDESSINLHFYTTGDPKKLDMIAEYLLGESGEVSQAAWTQEEDMIFWITDHFHWSVPND